MSPSLQRGLSRANSWEKNLHFVFLELCARPEYVQQLRDEIGDQGPLDYTKMSELPLLDSFIKEAVRLNPLDKSEYWEPRPRLSL